MGKSHNLTTANNDIQLAEPNSLGKDYLIGDLHGNSNVLAATLKKLNPNDRLMILGDLTDRGEDSPGVIKLINSVNSVNPGTIMAIRGNHENLTLDSISGLESIAGYIASLDSVEKLIEEVKTNNRHGDAGSKIKLHIRNGGKWLVTLFAKELSENKIFIDSTTKEIRYREDSEVFLIKKYMDSLPYIYHVKGAPGILPYQAVHADMPLSESEILTRANQKIGLTKAEIYYAIWARENSEHIQFSDKGRTETSILAFVGHNIVDLSDTSAYRLDTNTIDLDIASYKNDIAALFCITDGTCEFVGDGAEAAMEDPTLATILTIYQQKGLEIQLLKRMSLELSYCSSPEEIRDMLLATADRFETHATLQPAFKHTYDSLWRFAHQNGLISEENLHDLARLQLLENIKDTPDKDKPRIVAETAKSLETDVNSFIDYAVEKGFLTSQQATNCRFNQPAKGGASKLFTSSKESTSEPPTPPKPGRARL